MYVEVRILYVCHKFDIALDICTIRDIRHKISAHFNCVVLNRKYAVISFLLRVLFILHIVYSVLHILYFCLVWRINLIIYIGRPRKPPVCCKNLGDISCKLSYGQFCVQMTTFGCHGNKGV